MVCNPARGTVAALNDIDDGSDDEVVTEGATAVWMEHITQDYKLHLWNFFDTLLAFRKALTILGPNALLTMSRQCLSHA